MPTAPTNNETLILNRQQVREVDRRAIQDYGMTGLVLMENAGRGVADVLCNLLTSNSELTQNDKPSPQGEGRVRGSTTIDWAISERIAAHRSGKMERELVDRPLTPALSSPRRLFDPRQREQYIAIVCGKGNNGGDGFVIARHLDLRGIGVKILLLADPRELTGDAAANYAIAVKAGIEIEVFNSPLDVARFEAAIAGSAWLIDAILGTGATGEPKSPLAEAIDLMNASGKSILAVDLPSGLDCDTGATAQHTIRATHTCTFVAAKPGFMFSAAKPFVGQLHVLDIGVPRKLLNELIASSQEFADR